MIQKENKQTTSDCDENIISFEKLFPTLTTLKLNNIDKIEKYKIKEFNSENHNEKIVLNQSSLEMTKGAIEFMNCFINYDHF